MTTSPPDLSSLRIPREEARSDTPPQRPWLWLVLGVAALAVAFLAWRLARPSAIAVTTATATTTGGGIVAEGISANGYVVARTKASVSAKVPGRLEYLGVREGSHVKRGAVMARIESGDYQAALAAARATAAESEAQVAQARRDLERARRLRTENLISDAELENADTRLDVASAQLASARARAQLAAVNLENTRVRAPFDGTVLRKDAEVGEMVSPSSAGGGLTRTAIVTMADLGTLEVEVDVNEAYIAQIRNGQPARITLDAYPDTSFAGAVRQVVPTADRQKATVQVKVAITDRDPRILPEMGAKVVFLRTGGAESEAAVARPRVTVPAAAIVRSGETARVWIVEADRAVQRTVQLGQERGESIEIVEGLAGGERVVVRPPAGLKDGGKVRPAGTE